MPLPVRSQSSTNCRFWQRPPCWTKTLNAHCYANHCAPLVFLETTETLPALVRVPVLTPSLLATKTAHSPAAVVAARWFVGRQLEMVAIIPKDIKVGLYVWRRAFCSTAVLLQLPTGVPLF